MKVAVIGSRNLTVENLGQYLPEETTGDRVRRGERNRHLRKRLCHRKGAQAHRVSAGI